MKVKIKVIVSSLEGSTTEWTETCEDNGIEMRHLFLSEHYHAHHVNVYYDFKDGQYQSFILGMRWDDMVAEGYDIEEYKANVAAAA